MGEELSNISSGREPSTGGHHPSRGLYGISVAAELSGSVPQNLRLYESRGLLQPERSEGGTRRYSDNDVDRVRSIVTLLSEGLNLAGIHLVLELRATNALLRQQLADPASLAAPEGESPASRGPTK